MKKTARLFGIFALVISFIASSGIEANGQLRFGLKIGSQVSTMHFNKKLLDSDNRAGFTFGGMMEAGVGSFALDVSLMYVHAKISVESDIPSSGQQKVAPPDFDNNDSQGSFSSLKSRDYISIPVNLKYKLLIPGVSKIICPYFFTGPDFAFLASKKRINNALKNKGIDVSWDFGAGIQLVSKLQLSASYSIGITKAVESLSNIDGYKINGRNRNWTVTAAWLF